MEDEVPKHRKKKQKTVKKSDHKHDYQIIGVIDDWMLKNHLKNINYYQSYSFSVMKKCSVCSKEDREHFWRTSKEVFDEMVENYGLIEQIN